MKLSRTALISHIEIQQLLLEEYSREIFENVAQVLSLIRFQLLSFDPEATGNAAVFAESGKLVGKVIRDLKRLTRQVSPEAITKNGFAVCLQQELAQLQLAGLCIADFNTEGEPVPLSSTANLAVYSLVQQLINPLLSVTMPGLIRLHIKYRTNRILIRMTREFQGEPLYLSAEECRRYKKRAAMIGGRFTCKPEASTQLLLQIKRN